MRTAFFLSLLIVGATACHKPVEPVMPVPLDPNVDYVDLSNAEIPFNHGRVVDLNGDQQPDFNFEVLFTGDALFKKDNFFFRVTPKQQNLLLGNLQDESPMIKLNEKISSQFSGFGWQAHVPVHLAEKNLYENGTITWSGTWRDCSHKYVGVQLKKDNLNYFGWVELSLDGATNKLILHRAGVAKEPGKEILAGR